MSRSKFRLAIFPPNKLELEFYIRRYSVELWSFIFGQNWFCKITNSEFRWKEIFTNHSTIMCSIIDYYSTVEDALTISEADMESILGCGGIQIQALGKWLQPKNLLPF